MRKYLLLGIALICHAAPAQAAENSSKRYTIEQLMASDTIGGLSWSPDDTKLIFTSNRTGIANIYEMPSDGGKRSLAQSIEQPSRRNCCVIWPPDSAFHSHTLSTNCSRV